MFYVLIHHSLSIKSNTFWNLPFTGLNATNNPSKTVEFGNDKNVLNSEVCMWIQMVEMTWWTSFGLYIKLGLVAWKNLHFDIDTKHLVIQLQLVVVNVTHFLTIKWPLRTLPSFEITSSYSIDRQVYLRYIPYQFTPHLLFDWFWYRHI